MKLGLISDIHGNKVALELVLYKLRNEHNVDEIACAGDVIGVLGWPEEVAHIVRNKVDYCVYGNHDAYVRDDYSYVPVHDSQKQEHRVVTTELTEQSVDYLNNLPETITIDAEVKMAHANPYVENKCGFPADEYLDKRSWTKFGADHMYGQIVVMGHTHDQGALDVGKFDNQSGLIINPGSLGSPYHDDARYAIVDTETHEYWLYREHFDESEIVKRFEQLGIE